MASLLIVVIYLSFISLGLPDSLLGSSWPIMHQDFNVPVSYAGIISVLISICTIISSFFSEKITNKLGSGLVTIISIFITAVALLGFSLSNKFWVLIIFAIPYGLGAGAIDACLNNYVAVHFKSHHMNWLHCMWGVGASVSPYIMGYALTKTGIWNNGYFYVSIIQMAIGFIVLMSLPLWKKKVDEDKELINSKSLSIKEIFNIPGVLMCFITFLCYCAFEQTIMLWLGTYISFINPSETMNSSMFSSLFFIGMTIGRAICGLISMKVKDKAMINTGYIVILFGLVLVLVNSHYLLSYIGFLLIGLGCAPVYPSMIHLTPINFGKENSQAIVGIQMAFAYTGSLIIPSIFGILGKQISFGLFPYVLLILFLIMVICNYLMNRKLKK